MKNLTIEKITEVCEGTLYGSEWIKEEKREANSFQVRLQESTNSRFRPRRSDDDMPGPAMLPRQPQNQMVQE